MNMVEVNRFTLANLWEQYPNNFNGLFIDANMLVFENEHVDISEFNINDLLTGDSMFASSLSILRPIDIFKIIKVHALGLSSDLTLQEQKQERSSAQKLEEIKRENPLMKNIMIVTKDNGVSVSEYFNIVDSNGIDHIFFNDRKTDIFNIYAILQATHPETDVTPDELITAINRKLYEIRMASSDELGKDNESEDYQNKINILANEHKDNKSIRVKGNEEHGINLVTDTNDLDAHQVITYDQNRYGDVVALKHNQNVDSTITSAKESNDIQNENTVNKNTNEEIIVNDNKKEEIVGKLIPLAKFYDLLNSGKQYTEEDRKNVNMYYSFFGDLIIYEDFLLPELRNVLYEFRNYVLKLQINEDEVTLNSNQVEACDKLNELEQKKAMIHTDDPNKAKDNVMKLVKRLPEDYFDENGDVNKAAGNVSTMQLIWFIIGFASLLTVITLSLIK